MKKLRFGAIPALGLALCFCITLIFSPPLSAQTTYGSIAGTVTDPSGAAITDAQVTVTNVATAEKRVEPTGVDGLYSFVNLLPGRYRIDVEKAGFKRTTRSDVIVDVGQSIRIDLTMQVGDVTQTVEVTGETPQLQSETSSLGQVVEERKANELPLNGRNVFNLISLAPSVVPQGSAGGTPVGVNPFGWGNYQVNGSFGNESAEYLDGQPLNIGYINLPVVIPTQDSIQEFKVQTSNLGADWGKFSGGVINLSTKSGTNGLHGEAYEYLRNKVLDANDFGTAFTTTVPDSNFKSGNFASLCKTGFTGPGGICADTITDPKTGKTVFVDQVFDPCGGSVAPNGACNPNSPPPTPFRGNIIPSGRLNPTSLALLKFFPAANTTGTPGQIGNNFFTNNYTTATSGGGNQNQVVGRLDQSLGSNQHIFFRITYWNVLDLPVDPLGTGLCADRCATSPPLAGRHSTMRPCLRLPELRPRLASLTSRTTSHAPKGKVSFKIAIRNSTFLRVLRWFVVITPSSSVRNSNLGVTTTRKPTSPAVPSPSAALACPVSRASALQTSCLDTRITRAAWRTTSSGKRWFPPWWPGNSSIVHSMRMTLSALQTN